MAKRSISIKGQSMEDELAGTAQERDLSDDMLEGVTDVFAGSPGQVRARCFKIQEDGSEAHIFDFGPDDVQSIFERVRENYGSGKYQVTVFKKGKYQKRFAFSVLAPPNWKPKSEAPERAAGIDPALAAILDRMEKRSAQTDAMLVMMAGRLGVASPAVDPGLQMKSLVETMVALKSLTAEGQGRTTTDLILEGVKLAKELSSGDRETNVLDLVRSALESPMVGQFMEGMKQTVAQPVQTPQLVQAKPETVAPPAAAADVRPDHPLKAQLTFLCDRAAAGSPPELYAAVLADSLPDQALDMLLEHPDVLGALRSIEPAIAGHLPWFSALIDGVRASVAEDDSPDVPESTNARGPATPSAPPGNSFRT